jgi:hypothetical protein
MHSAIKQLLLTKTSNNYQFSGPDQTITSI